MIAAIENGEGFDQGRLRFDRDHCGAKPPKGCDSVSHMGADVEYEIAGIYELPIEKIHCGARGAIAIVDTKRTHDAFECSPRVAPRRVAPRAEPRGAPRVAQ